MLRKWKRSPTYDDVTIQALRPSTIGGVGCVPPAGIPIIILIKI